MVNYSKSTLDDTFSALASPIRRGMLERLSQGWATVSELAAPYDVSPPAISKHLRLLERIGLIECRKRGRVHYCRLIPQPMQEAIDWLNFYKQFWEAQFDSLADFLAQEDGDRDV
jgi:DNA-binding transcriptional ArsR family regulator